MVFAGRDVRDLPTVGDDLALEGTDVEGDDLGCVVRVVHERRVSAVDGGHEAVLHPGSPAVYARARSCDAGSRTLSAYDLTVVTAKEDIASVAGQMADLTRVVAAMEAQLRAMGDRADSQQREADSQQARTEAQEERIDIAARELAEVSERLHAAANALRESI